MLLQEVFEALISTGSKLLLLLLHRRRQTPLMLLPGCRGLQVGTAATSWPHPPLPRQLCLLHGCLQQGQSSRRHVIEQGCQTLQCRTGACLTIGASVAVTVTVFTSLGVAPVLGVLLRCCELYHRRQIAADARKQRRTAEAWAQQDWLHQRATHAVLLTLPAAKYHLLQQRHG